jgi:hypothetical protein
MSIMKRQNGEAFGLDLVFPRPRSASKSGMNVLGMSPGRRSPLLKKKGLMARLSCCVKHS